MGERACYEFTLILDGEEFDEEIAEALYGAGCDDCSYGVSCFVPRVMFHRVEDSGSSGGSARGG